MDPGAYYFNLSPSNFENLRPEYEPEFRIVQDGVLIINPIQPVEKIIHVGIIGKTESSVYDGEPHAVEGYDISVRNEDYSIEDVEYIGDIPLKIQETDAGSYKIRLLSSDFRNKNEKYKVNFQILHNTQLIIRPLSADVSAYGQALCVSFDSEEHVVSGISYDIRCDRDLYKQEYLKYNSDNISACGTEAGLYTYILSSSMFENTNRNFFVDLSVMRHGSLSIVNKEYVPESKIPVSLSVTAPNSIVGYDGDPHGINGIEWTADPDIDVKYDGPTSVSGTHSGTY